MTRVKICGLLEEEHALTAAISGADFLGFVFAPGKRQITPERAGRIVSAVRRRNLSPLTVGVFVNEDPAEVNRMAAYIHLDMVQLSGDERPEYCLEIAKPIIKAIHVSGDKTAELVNAEIAAILNAPGVKKVVFLLDTRDAGLYGGTGKTFDWQLLKEISPGHPLLVAGGLTPGNVGELVSNIRPWGVDVSSGVETDGKKDNAKIRAFIEAVKNPF